MSKGVNAGHSCQLPRGTGGQRRVDQRHGRIQVEAADGAFALQLRIGDHRIDGAFRAGTGGGRVGDKRKGRNGDFLVGMNL